LRQEQKKMKPVLFIIAPKDFRDEELFITQAELEKSGISTTIASSITGECIGSKGGKAISNYQLDQINLKDYSTIVYIGGMGSRVFFDDPKAISLAKEMHAMGSPVAAICIAPVILAKAGLLNHKRATVFSSEIETLESLGAYYTGMDVTVDDNIITAYGPQSALRFAKRIVEKISEKQLH
jgi:protease I